MKEEKIDPKENRRENIIALLVVLAIGVVIGYFIYKGMQPSPEDENVRYPLYAGNSPTLGSDDAPVTVIEFSDFECPYCATFALEHFPKIKEQYIDTGQVRFVFKQLPLIQIHGHAMLAAEAALCAHEQDTFWEYHDILYEHQEELEIGQLQHYAEELGLNMSTFNNCFIPEATQADVNEDRTLARRAGVTGTPTFFFNGRKVTGILTPEAFGAEVAKE